MSVCLIDLILTCLAGGCRLTGGRMIRDGMARKLAAEATRTRLLEQWQAYPLAVQQRLTALLQDYGLQVAKLATEAVEEYARSVKARETTSESTS